MTRPICKNCRIKPAAVNYIKNGIHHYRSFCESCIRSIANPKKMQVPNWLKSGYKKKMVCDQCRFKAVTEKQMTVFYIDGDMKNNNWLNLKTVCANCAIGISVNGLVWKEDPIRPDF